MKIEKNSGIQNNYKIELLEFIAPRIYKAIKDNDVFRVNLHIISFFEYDLTPKTDINSVIDTVFFNSNDVKRLKECDKEFLKMEDSISPRNTKIIDNYTGDFFDRVKLILSIIYTTFYLLFISAMFFVEVSDNVNMKEGENSLKDLLQILIGVLTAGLTQIMSFWFGRR